MVASGRSSCLPAVGRARPARPGLAVELGSGLRAAGLDATTGSLLPWAFGRGASERGEVLPGLRRGESTLERRRRAGQFRTGNQGQAGSNTAWAFEGQENVPVAQKWAGSARLGDRLRSV